VFEFALARLQPVGNFPQRTGLGQLTKQHRDKLIPARKAATMMFGFKFADVARKIRSLKKGKNLAKQTAGVTHFGLRG
jgi:hypothetical protein